MVTLFLVRHAVHAVVDSVLVGRMSGIRLDERGRGQARVLAEHLARAGLARLQSSPRERALETAEPIAQGTGLAVEIATALDEIDIGDWTGRDFDALATDPSWHVWNTERGSARPPRGESMGEVQDRALRHLDGLRSANPDGRVAVVTHAEVIRAALLRYLGLPLDAFAAVEIRPASISTVRLGDDGSAKILAVNETVSP